MKKIAAIMLAVVCLAAGARAGDYETLIREAEAGMAASRYAEALATYREAFDTGRSDPEDLYNAACAAARSSDPEAAFTYLRLAMGETTLAKAWLEDDEDLAGLHDDPRWDDLLAAVDARVDSIVAALPDSHTVIAAVMLPAPRLSSDVSVEEALAKRRSVRAYEDSALALAEVSQLLWSAYGLTRPIEGAPAFLRGGLRTAPSAGALYPLEIYLVAKRVEGLEAGIYLYDSQAHRLSLLDPGDRWGDLAAAAFNQPHFETAAAAIVYSAVFERTTGTYGSRGRERYVCMDLGHSAENVYLQAAALGIGTCAIGAFNDLALKQVVGMTKAEEPLYIMPIGKAE
jgi:SagB-type dehydrogenase family enzyme